MYTLVVVENIIFCVDLFFLLYLLKVVKEKESRNLYSLYNGNGGSATNGAAKTNGATTSNGGVYDVYKGAATLTEEMTPIKMENEEQPMDSVLAKYLDRDYWERKRTNMKEVGVSLGHCNIFKILL